MEERYVGIRMVDRTFTRTYSGPIKLNIGVDYKLEIGTTKDLEIQRDPNNEPFVIIDRDREKSMPLRDGERVLLSDSGPRDRFGFSSDEKFRVGVKRKGEQITIIYLGDTAPVIAVRQPQST